MRFTYGRMMHCCFAVLVAIFAVNAPASASADLITFSFTGTVNSVDPLLAGTFSAGQALTGSYTFESTTSARVGSDSSTAAFDALTSLNFAIGGYSASSSAAPEIQIDNDSLPPFGDRYAVVSRAIDGLTGPPVAGLPLIFYSFRLDDSTNAVFSDALILPTSLNLSDFDNREFFIFFGDIASPAIVSGTITSVTAIPEPSSLALAGIAGLYGLALLWRRRRESD